ncbi:MAG: arginase family protein [archaeon]
MKTSIIKIPFDACIVERDRRGAAKGPEAVISELGKLSDFKDVKILEVSERDDFVKLHKDSEKTATDAYKKKNLVIGLGGDHSVSYGLMHAFAKAFPHSGLLYFDAHLDCDVDFLPATHEDILRAAVNEHMFDGIFVVGARKYAPNELEFVKKEKIPFEKNINPESILEFCRNFKNIYISIDIDVIDPKLAPGTGYPEADGLNEKDFISILEKTIATKKVRGADLVEVSPPKDKAGMTSKLAASLLLRFLK